MKTSISRRFAPTFLRAAGISLALAAVACFADAPAAEELLSVTNLATCHQKVRNAYRDALVSAGRAGDDATFGALVRHLGECGGAPVQTPVFDIWAAAAKTIVDRGLAVDAKPAAERAEIIAGFREGSSTFGFWAGSDEIAKKSPRDRASAAAFDMAIELLERKMPQKGLSPELRYRAAQSLAQMSRRVLSSEAAGRFASDRFRTLALSVNPVSPEGTNVLIKAVDDSFWPLIQYCQCKGVGSLVREYREKLGPVLDAAGQTGALAAREAAEANRLFDNAAYKALLPALEAALKNPRIAYKTAMTFNSAMTTARSNPPWAEIGRALKPILDNNRQFDDEKRLQLAFIKLQVARGTGDTAGVEATFNAMQDIYDAAVKAKNAEDERERQWKIDDAAARKEGKSIAPFERKVPRSLPNDVPGRERVGVAGWLLNAGAVDAAIPLFKRAAVPRNPKACLELARAAAIGGNREEALAACGMIQGTNSTADAMMKINALFFAEYVQSTSPEDLVKRLKALRPRSDAAAGENATAADKDRFYLDRLRHLSRSMYTISSDQRGTAMMKAVVDLSYAQLWPEETVSYRVRYLDEAPTSAETALRLGLFDKLPNENRLGRYNVYNIFKKDKELKRVRGEPAPHLAADKPGCEAAVISAYDRMGLHLYAKFNDPDAWKTRDGFARGVAIEYTIMPGEGRPWHWNMLNTADKPSDAGVFWDSPRKGFKYGMEYITEDFYVGENCHVVHLFFPWLLFAYDLPENGAEWRLSFIAEWAGQFGALGGGAVHELGRAMRLDFDVPRAQRDILHLSLLRQAVGEYGRVRGKFENAEFWIDPHLGDRPFYRDVVVPWLTELDGVAKQVREGGALDSATVDRILGKYLFEFADFRLAIDAKRAAWVRDSLLRP